MFLSQIRKLRELQDTYQHELAVAKQSGIVIEDEKERLAVLALLELNTKIVSAVHDYVNMTGEEPINISTVCSAFEVIMGQLHGKLHTLDPEMQEFATKLGKQLRQTYFEEAIR